ncbi:cytochrome b-c1 complex, subunit 6 [Artemisia annua]|uniref:Complex III subunit VI n=1 Tax=Artemisia annua TaxID=35608 RepID=A0A2U1MI69_ARTAN|nr:cytochrome b-c1 complex, subunit 6 [Artemisia annua]
MKILSFMLGGVVGAYIAQNYDLPDIKKKFNECHRRHVKGGYLQNQDIYPYRYHDHQTRHAVDKRIEDISDMSSNNNNNNMPETANDAQKYTHAHASNCLIYLLKKKNSFNGLKVYTSLELREKFIVEQTQGLLKHVNSLRISEIASNSQFLEDLEMMTFKPAEPKLLNFYDYDKKSFSWHVLSLSQPSLSGNMGESGSGKNVVSNKYGYNLEAEQPQYAACPRLLCAGPSASLSMGIRVVAKYADEVVNDKTASSDVDQCLRLGCVKRVQDDETGHKHCTGQYFDYWQCVDKCVTPRLFAKLK